MSVFSVAGPRHYLCMTVITVVVLAVLYREELIEHKAHKVMISTMEVNRNNTHIISNGAGSFFEFAKNCTLLPAASEGTERC